MASGRRTVYRAVAGVPGDGVIPVAEYSRILEVLPILCVDVVVQSDGGEYLLVKRSNEPRRGQWWVVGGRVVKGETLRATAVRKVREETGLEVSWMQAIGYYEAVCQEHPFGSHESYHAVSVVFTARVSDFRGVRLDDQSTEWKATRELPKDFEVRSWTS